MKTTIALLSGGLDSATSAAQAVADGYEVIALSFDYGQRHSKELKAASRIVQILGLKEHHLVKIDLARWGGSALTDAALEVPTAGVTPGEIPNTYVPGRNTVFLAVALSLAEAREAEAIYLGINAVDYSGYPDCRPEYLEAFQRLADLATKAGLKGRGPRLVAPLISDHKVDIVRRAVALGVPIAETWSCYQGGEQPCGVCDSCRIRDTALLEAGYPEFVSPARILGTSHSSGPEQIEGG